MTDLPDFLKQGEAARLFPVLSTTSKEGRATSILLSCMDKVDEFAAELLKNLGLKPGKRTVVQSYTEVVFQDTSQIQLMPNFGISLTKDPYKWIHSRTVFSKWGSHNIEKLKEAVGKDGYKEFWRKKEAPKNRYIQILGQTKGETKK